MEGSSQDILYRNQDDPATVLSLECNSLKADTRTLVHGSSVKIESLAGSSGQSLNRVSSADVNASAVPGNINSAAAADWTPLTPPQSALQ